MVGDLENITIISNRASGRIGKFGLERIIMRGVFMQIFGISIALL